MMGYNIKQRGIKKILSGVVYPVLHLGKFMCTDRIRKGKYKIQICIYEWWADISWRYLKIQIQNTDLYDQWKIRKGKYKIQICMYEWWAHISWRSVRGRLASQPVMSLLITLRPTPHPNPHPHLHPHLQPHICLHHAHCTITSSSSSPPFETLILVMNAP